MVKALVYEGPREMYIREVGVPVLGAEEVLVRVRYSGICGSELSGYLGRNSMRKPPLIFGHEFSGTIEQMGENTTTYPLRVGQRVTVNPLISCTRCRYCLSGQQQLCAQRQLLSASLPGSNAEYVKVPARSVHVLPEHLSLEQGALVEPVACAVRAVKLASIRPSDTVLIVGLGPIGVFALKVLKLHGVESIVAVDMNPDRLELAGRLGATTLSPKDTEVVEEIERLTDGNGVDAAIEAVGAGITRSQCFQCVAAGGSVVFMGLHEAESQLPVNTMVRREVRCIGSFAYSDLDFQVALRWLSEDRIGLEDGLVKSPLQDGSGWFERLLDDPGSVVKVLLHP